jgi:hypothetical protein
VSSKTFFSKNQKQRANDTLCLRVSFKTNTRCGVQENKPNHIGGVSHKKEMSAMQWKSGSVVSKQNHQWKTHLDPDRLVLHRL